MATDAPTNNEVPGAAPQREVFDSPANTQEEVDDQVARVRNLMGVGPEENDAPPRKVIPFPMPKLSATETQPATAGPAATPEASAATQPTETTQPVPLAQDAYETVAASRATYTAEQKAAGAAEAARAWPVRLIRNVGRRIGVVKPPLYTKP
jgi:hypothetical protein